MTSLAVEAANGITSHSALRAANLVPLTDNVYRHYSLPDRFQNPFFILQIVHSSVLPVIDQVDVMIANLLLVSPHRTAVCEAAS